MASGGAGEAEKGRGNRGRLGDANRKTKRDETFVNPWIKWLMFSFNMFFWVSTMIVNNLIVSNMTVSKGCRVKKFIIFMELFRWRLLLHISFR